MLIPFMHDRILSALAGTPDVLDALIETLKSDDTAWDYRPDPDRFTIREIIAHLMDYEAIWRERILETRDAEQAVFQRVDPGELAITNNYAQSDPKRNAALFRERRTALVETLKDLQDADWHKIAKMGGAGPLTLEEQAGFICVHDGYHTGQIAQWLASQRG